MEKKKLLLSLVVLTLIVLVAWFPLHNLYMEKTHETMVTEVDTEETRAEDFLNEVERLREDIKKLEWELFDKERRIRELEEENKALMEKLVVVEEEKRLPPKAKTHKETGKTFETTYMGLTPITTSSGHISVGEQMLPPNNLLEILRDAKSRIPTGFGGVELRKARVLGNYVFVYVAAGATPNTKPHLYKLKYDTHTKEFLGMDKIG